MKKILITGANSYIGMSFENYLNKNYPNDYQVDTVDMIDGTWKNKDFSEYDVVFHVAGIAHQKETKENAPLYYKVNRDLAIETAQKAKKEGVSQFVFLSSMSVYGMETGIITKETIPSPKSNYGKSKFQAEEKLAELRDNKFKVAIIRPPMVYGEGCKGNYQFLTKVVKKSPVFPKVNNQRSMIHIDNLVEFVRIAIDEQLSGVYCPQNQEYVNTKEMAAYIAKKLGKKIYFSYLGGLAVIIFRPFMGVLKKAFGTLIYKETEELNFKYCIRDNFELVPKSKLED